MQLPRNLDQFVQIIMDSYFVVDMDLNIVDFNQALHAMLPRPLARKLKSKKCYEVLDLEICQKGCIAKECWEERGPIRLDEISGTVAGTKDQLVFILGAIPLFAPDGEMIGALVTHRNVTDEAQVQEKYQQQVEASASDHVELASEFEARTRRLFEMSRQVHALQKELLRCKSFRW